MIKNALLIMSLASAVAGAQQLVAPVRGLPFVRNPITNLPNQGSTMRLPIVITPVAGLPSPIITIPVMPHQTAPTVLRHQTQATAVAELPETRPVLPSARARLTPRGGRGITVEALNAVFDNKGPKAKTEPVVDADEIPETPEPRQTLPESDLEREIGIP